MQKRARRGLLTLFLMTMTGLNLTLVLLTVLGADPTLPGTPPAEVSQALARMSTPLTPLP